MMDYKEAALLRITNTLLLYCHHTQSDGLYYGRTGIMFYLFLYADYSRNEYVYNFASDILDKLIENGKYAPSSFENGLSGLGWTICRLLGYNIIGLSVKSHILENIDKKLISDLTLNQWSNSWLELIYFCERLKSAPNVSEYKNAILIITYINWYIFEKKHSLSIEQKKSVLLFVNCYISRVPNESCKATLNEINRLKAYIESDIVNHVIENENESKNKILQKKILQFCKNELKEPISYDIKVLYDDVVFLQANLTDSKLGFLEGLAGIGTILIKTNLY